MDFFEADINYLAVLLGAIAAQPIGFLWYSPALFGGRWMELRGYTQEDVQDGGSIPYVVGVVAALAVAYGLARLADMTGAFDVGECIALAAFCWVSFTAIAVATQVAFSRTQSVELFAIEAGYWLASFLTIGVIVGAFQ
jgi:hypothetical protein